MRTNSLAHWERQFPGTSAVIASARHSVAVADHLARLHKSQFQAFDRELRLTGLPLYLWDPQTLSKYKQSRRFYLNLLKQFHTALRYLKHWSRKCEINFPQSKQHLTPAPTPLTEPRPVNSPTERHFHGKHT